MPILRGPSPAFSDISLDAEVDLLDFDIQEVSVSQAILRQSRHTVLVADHTKLARTAPVRIASLANLDAIYADASLHPSQIAACAIWSTAIIQAG